MTSDVRKIPIDPAAQALELAKLFNDVSFAIDEYRLSEQDPPLSKSEKSRLKNVAQGMEDSAHYLTAEAIGATLEAIQPQLDNIKLITIQAKTQLEVLKDAEKVIVVATLALNLGTAMAAGNPLSIIAAADELAETLTA